MRKISLIFGYILLAGGAVSMIVPFLWMVSVSFMQDSQIFSIPPAIFPNPLIFDNYTNVFSNINITKFFLNSLFVALLTTVFQVVFSAFAGYAFARARFRGRDLLFFLFLLTMMIPPQVNIIPLFFLMRELGWVDTYQALILPGIFGGFGVFLMRQWFMSFSKEIEDAHFISSCHIRKADGKIGFVGIHKPKFHAFSFGEFDVYSPFLQIGDERRGR